MELEPGKLGFPSEPSELLLSGRCRVDTCRRGAVLQLGHRGFPQPEITPTSPDLADTQGGSGRSGRKLPECHDLAPLPAGILYSGVLRFASLWPIPAGGQAVVMPRRQFVKVPENPKWVAVFWTPQGTNTRSHLYLRPSLKAQPVTCVKHDAFQDTTLQPKTPYHLVSIGLAVPLLSKWGIMVQWSCLCPLFCSWGP